MKIQRHLLMLCLGILLSPTLVSAGSEASAVNVYNTKYETNVLIRKASSGATIAGNVTMQNDLAELVTAATTFVKANISTIDQPAGIKLDLGTFDSEIILKLNRENNYVAEFTMSLHTLDGVIKTVGTELEIGLGEEGIITEDGKQRLIEQFSLILNEQFQEMESNYGKPFREALNRFSSKYLIRELEDAPIALEQMINSLVASLEPMRRVEPDPVWVHGATREAIQKPIFDPLHVKQDNYMQTEALNFVEGKFHNEVTIIPQYEIMTTFNLTVLLEGQSERQVVADVSYFTTIVPRPEGDFQSTFEVRLVYGADSTEISTAASLRHEGDIEEIKFFPRWKKAFLTKLAQKILNSAKSEAEERDRILLISYLEPYMYEEYYDFEPFLVKAKMEFSRPVIQKELEKLIEEQSKPADLEL